MNGYSYRMPLFLQCPFSWNLQTPLCSAGGRACDDPPSPQELVFPPPPFWLQKCPHFLVQVPASVFPEWHSDLHFLLLAQPNQDLGLHSQRSVQPNFCAEFTCIGITQPAFGLACVCAPQARFTVAFPCAGIAQPRFAFIGDRAGGAQFRFAGVPHVIFMSPCAISPQPIFAAEGIAG